MVLYLDLLLAPFTFFVLPMLIKVHTYTAVVEWGGREEEEGGEM